MRVNVMNDVKFRSIVDEDDDDDDGAHRVRMHAFPTYKTRRCFFLVWSVLDGHLGLDLAATVNNTSVSKRHQCSCVCVCVFCLIFYCVCRHSKVSRSASYSKCVCCVCICECAKFPIGRKSRLQLNNAAYKKRLCVFPMILYQYFNAI